MPDFKYVQLPDSSYAQFPAEMSDDSIAAVLQKQSPAPSQQQTPVEPDYATRVSRITKTPGRMLNEAISNYWNNPIESTGKVINAFAMLPAVGLSPITEANIPVISSGLKGVFNTTAGAANTAVGVGSAGINVLPLPENIKNLGMSEQEAQKANAQMQGVNTNLALALAPKVIPSAMRAIKENLSGTPTEQFISGVKAAAPARTGEVNFNKQIGATVPALRRQQLESPIETMRQATDASVKAKLDVFKDYEGKMEPIKTQLANLDIPKQEILGTVTDHMRRFEPEAVAKVEAYAANYNKAMTVEQANQYLKELNAEPAVRAFYQAAPEQQAAILQTNPMTAVKIAEADGLRESLMDAFERNGIEGAMEARKTYGNLKFAENVFRRNIVRSERTTPFIQKAAGRVPKLIGIGTTYASHSLGSPAGSLAMGLAADALATKYMARYLPNETIARAFKALEQEGTTPVQYPPLPPVVFPDSTGRYGQ